MSALQYRWVASFYCCFLQDSTAAQVLFVGWLVSMQQEPALTLINPDWMSIRSWMACWYMLTFVNNLSVILASLSGPGKTCLGTASGTLFCVFWVARLSGKRAAKKRLQEEMEKSKYMPAAINRATGTHWAGVVVIWKHARGIWTCTSYRGCSAVRAEESS